MKAMPLSFRFPIIRMVVTAPQEIYKADPRRADIVEEDRDISPLKVWIPISQLESAMRQMCRNLDLCI
jgi:hypothetical protein